MFPQIGRLTDAMRSVFVELLVHGPLSRAEVARRLSLSPSALTKVTRPFIEAGYLLEAAGEGPATVGRPSQPLRVDASRMSFAGIKLTADDLFAVRTDLGARVERETSRPLASHDIGHVLGQIVEVVEELTVPGRPLSAVGISLAGTATPSDPVVHTSPFLGWSRLPLGRLVEEAVSVPTVLDNDVRALTAVQQWFGEGVGHSSFALLTVGAGIGCGLVIDDRLVSGRSGLVGHLRIDDRGPMCERGHRGCARAYASSPSIRRSIASTLERPELTFDDCLTLAADGDPVARRVLDEAGAALGQVAATVANLTAPELIVLSGESVHMYDVCAPAFDAALAHHTHWTATPVRVAVKPFTFNEWARGAAVTALQHLLLNR
ncbi:Sugar kinase of the NBD/HSP70 family, may contain an N-terminal HTH domain [Nonomuraea solani]|uniref:Sugar kinase of the NBD/HSP70 family, may contain an N-terminal HTH domain n=1 Tax=Nonomuraea solani TaxID=1144553 RepID=A0A1H6EUT0_9ACTN|nr:ROK family protein [Nonomuraea solani]SEH01660.1 Sugar kinase of the NBD/HSP70 family, may contain an N-terminal HTH domain [Nonomuraea solani]